MEVDGIKVPKVIVCTDRRVCNYCKELEIIKIRLNLNNIDKLIKDIISLVQEYGYKVK